MRSLILILVSVISATAWADGPAPSLAPAAASAAPPPAGDSKEVQLGKIQVHSDPQALVQTLREIKVAVKRPFDNVPAHFDDMVCRIDSGEGHMGVALECGTQGWFSMRRSEFKFGNFGMPGPAAVPTLGHPWHVVRALNARQAKTLRDLLRELPPPGQGEVQIEDDTQAPTAEQKH